MIEPKMTAIAPVLQVADLDRAVDHFTRVLDFKLAWIAGGHPPTHASVCRDAIYLMIRVAAAPVPAEIYVEVEGIDAYFQRVTGRGAKVVHPLADRDYGMRDGRVADPDGNQISFGQALAKE